MARSIAEILADVPSRFRGPGGAVAVLKDGALVGKHCWGYADLHARIPMTDDTVLPICSITKQMLCGLLTDLDSNPPENLAARKETPAELVEAELANVLPRELLSGSDLTLRHLCHNQSGIRDYWALTVLWGARPEGHFSIEEHGPQMLSKLTSFHFTPGTEYSYANTNFYIIARCIERTTGRSLSDLLDERIFAPAGMKTAKLCAHAAEHPPPCVGYEGDEASGYYPGVNCIEWAGDAGIVASLADMIAYEQFVDRSAVDKAGNWYTNNAEQQHYSDGGQADYGFGLARKLVGGVMTLRHGGALRGYRLSRCYAPEPRISVVVLLNSERGDAGGVTDYILNQMLDVPEVKHDVVTPGQNWPGTYLDEETGLAVIVTKSGEGELAIQYHRAIDKVRLVGEFQARSEGMAVTLDGDTLHVEIPADHRTLHARRVPDKKPSYDTSELVGDYYCADIDSTFHCSGSGDMLYGSFDGFLGQGPVHMIRPLGEGVWAIVCPRGMDAQPPGDWTTIIHRGDDGKVARLTIGCWLARGLDFLKQC